MTILYQQHQGKIEIKSPDPVIWQTQILFFSWVGYGSGFYRGLDPDTVYLRFLIRSWPISTLNQRSNDGIGSNPFLLRIWRAERRMPVGAELDAGGRLQGRLAHCLSII